MKKMGIYDSLGRDFPAETRVFGDHLYELYDHPDVSEGTKSKKKAQKVADERRSYGDKARVIQAKGKYWVYWCGC